MRLPSTAALAAMLAVATLAPVAGHAAPQLAGVFADHMVLQQGTFVPVWGRAAAGEKIAVSLADKTAAATADAKGAWLCTLPPLTMGGPFELVVQGATTVKVKDVLVGEVWLCAGASNMALDVQRAADAEKEIAAAAFPKLRLHRVAEGQAGWRPCTADSVAGFSAVAYYFGRALHRKLGVPVGLIENAEPQSPAEAWVSREALLALPQFRELLERMANYNFEAAAHKLKMQTWRQKALAVALQKDEGTEGEKAPWASPALNAAEDPRWEGVELPRPPEERFESPWRLARGVTWFRREVALPAALAGKELTLRLGLLDDELDTVFLNGTRLEPTRGGVLVPAPLAKAGRALVAVRVANLLDRGLTFLYMPKERMALAAGADGPAVPLAGAWRHRAGVRLRTKHLPALPPPLPPRPSDKLSPSALFAKRVEPLAPFAVRGVAWYQGEANALAAAQYRTLFPALIADWRKRWRRPKLPFLYVQLAGCARKRKAPGDDAWAELREAQALALTVPHTAMAVALDTGRTATPPDKQVVGRRLALAARGSVYGEKVAWRGPLYDKMTPEGDRVRLTFRHVAGGLAVDRGDTSRLFAVAGHDRKFVWADFKVDGGTVLVWSRSVPNPVAVRYAWEHSPRFELRHDEGWITHGLLFNADGLPAAPFRTDAWPRAARGDGR